MLQKKILFLFFMLPFHLCIYAEHDHPELTSKQWEKISNGVDYTETKKDKENKRKENPLEESNTPKPLDYNLGGLKYVFYFIVLGLVLFLIIKIIINFNKNPTINKVKISLESIQEIEEKMHEIDLDQLLKEALSAEKYRIALRINFLIIIKMLTKKNHIIWAKEKTNWEYVEEIKKENINALFKGVVLSFEPVWYGEHQLSNQQYHKLSPPYEHLKKQLSPDE